MKYILENPYRILGIYSNSSLKEVQKALSKLKAFTKINKQYSSIDFQNKELLFPNFKVDQKTVDLIQRNLNIDIDKIKFSLYWFNKGNLFDEKGINFLKEKKINEAIKLWSKVVEKNISKSNFSTFNNLSTLLLIKNIDKTSNNISLNKSKESMKELGESISLKYKLLNSKFSNDFFELITNSKKSFLKTDIIDFYNDSIDNLLNINFSENEINNLYRGFDNELLGQINASQINDLINSIRFEIKKCQNLRNSGEDIITAGTNLMSNTKSLVNKLKLIVGKSNVQYITYVNEIVNEIEQCGKMLIGDDKNFQEVYKFGILIAENLELKNKIKQILKRSKEMDKAEGSSDVLKALKKYSETIESVKMESKLYHVKKLIDDCIPSLDILKQNLGKQNDIYINLCSSLTNTSLSTIIEFANNENDKLNNLYNMIKLRAGSQFLMIEEVKTASNKNLKNLRLINRFLKILEKLNLDSDTKDNLDRNKKILRSNLSQANSTVNSLKGTSGGYSYNRSSYNSNYNYSSNYNSGDDIPWGCIIWGIILFIIFAANS